MARKKTDETAAPDEPAEETDGQFDISKPPKFASATTAVKNVRVTIVGMAPGLLMSSKGGMVAEEERNKQQKIATREEQARNAAYWIPPKKKGDPAVLGVPWENLYKCICEGAKRFKYRGRETMAGIVAATISCPEAIISLGVCAYEIDSRWGRIPPKTGGTVMLNRALLRTWRLTFTINVDDEFYKAEALHTILAAAGKLVGICANRPGLKGPYGKFGVEAFEVLN